MGYFSETLTYGWFLNYFLAIAIVIVPFFIWYLIIEVIFFAGGVLKVGKSRNKTETEKNA